MIVVSDTSPLLNLARIGHLDLLARLYREVVIPSAVNVELRRSNFDLPTPFEPGSIPWLTVAQATDLDRVRELRRELDAGEAEAIVLAIERKADLLLIDERRGRRTAKAAGLKVSGLLGVIASAKLAGVIPRAKPIIDDLIQTARFWIGPNLYKEVLRELGELDAD